MAVKIQRDGKLSSTVHSRRLDHGQAVAAGDVDGDSDRDLYVVQSGVIGDGAPDAPDLMLLNHEGLSFSRMPIPQTEEGRGEAVAAIDYDRNGLSDFIVMNGLGTVEGPIRLVAFRHGGAR
jgi:hypothetical protein